MRKTFISFSLVVICVLNLQAQEKILDKTQYLKIDYDAEYKIDVEKTINQIPAAHRAAYADMIREEVKKGIFLQYTLKTDGEKSIFQIQTKSDNNQTGIGVIANNIANMDKEPYYKNIKENQYVKAGELPFKYIIKDSLIDYKWEISKEQSSISGLKTLRADGIINDTIIVTAWYAPQLTLKDGPSVLWGLPGLILQASFDTADTEITYTAKNIEIIKEKLILPSYPTGKTITQKEFEKEIIAFRERMKEMYEDEVDIE